MRRCIYADSLLTKIKAYRPYMYLGEDALSYSIKMVELEPTVDVRENVRGEWEDAVVGTSTGYTYHEKRCSICGHSEVLPMNFCPNCGAQMRGEQDDER